MSAVPGAAGGRHCGAQRGNQWAAVALDAGGAAGAAMGAAEAHGGHLQLGALRAGGLHDGCWGEDGWGVGRLL